MSVWPPIKNSCANQAVILKDTTVEWFKCDVPRRAASVAYFAAFTLAPLLVVMIGVFSLMMSQEVMRDALLDEIRNLAGPQASEFADKLLTNMSGSDKGLWGTIIGLGISIFAATTVFSQLQHHMNQIWEVSPKPGKGILVFLRARGIAFVYILVIGLLLLSSIAIDAALVGFRDTISAWLPGKFGLVSWGNALFWFLVSIGIFASMFKFMPDIRLRWRDTLPGAAVTAILFSVGREGVGLYLGKSAAVSAFGAAGALAIILFWVYYTCMVFLYGVVYCRSYLNHHERQVKAKSYASKGSS
ncbi:MAG: YihY/virulence factor BrkB family protein [Akkermansiaceae bacterium]|nr:YihY/virulence factor BrkB family protein [Akkermansiaceae bacterium]